MLTADFPHDHDHHRGLFWAWPHVGAGGAEYSLWTLSGIRPHFEHWIEKPRGLAAAVLGVQNGWYVGDQRVVEERVQLLVYAASGNDRTIEIELTWTAVAKEVSLRGAEGKGFGGLNLRFGSESQTVITTPAGQAAKNLNLASLAWADLTAQFRGAPARSGLAIFVDPAHPGFPPTWITRHYRFLGAGWPGIKPVTLRPGEPATVRMRFTATEVVAPSKTKGGSTRVGAAMAMGLVPKRASAPKVGTMEGGQLVMQTPIMSCFRASIE